MGKLLTVCVDRLCLWFAKKRIGNLVKAAMKTHKNTLNTHGRKCARANVEVMSAAAKTNSFLCRGKGSDPSRSRTWRGSVFTRFWCRGRKPIPSRSRNNACGREKRNLLCRGSNLISTRIGKTTRNTNSFWDFDIWTRNKSRTRTRKQSKP